MVTYQTVVRQYFEQHGDHRRWGGSPGHQSWLPSEPGLPTGTRVVYRNTGREKDRNTNTESDKNFLRKLDKLGPPRLCPIGTNVVGKVWHNARFNLLGQEGNIYLVHIANLINLTCCIIVFLYFYITDFHISDQEDTGALMQMVQLVPATDSICQLRWTPSSCNWNGGNEYLLGSTASMLTVIVYAYNMLVSFLLLSWANR